MENAEEHVRTKILDETISKIKEKTCNGRIKSQKLQKNTESTIY